MSCFTWRDQDSPQGPAGEHSVAGSSSSVWVTVPKSACRYSPRTSQLFDSIHSTPPPATQPVTDDEKLPTVKFGVPSLAQPNRRQSSARMLSTLVKAAPPVPYSIQRSKVTPRRPRTVAIDRVSLLT